MPLEELVLSGGQLLGSGQPEIIETRDPILWPYSSSSVWNTPIGDAADYGDLSHPMAVNIRNSIAFQLNYATFSTPINRAKAGDPPITLREVIAGSWSPSQGDHEIPRAPGAFVIGGDFAFSGPVYEDDGRITFTGTVKKPDMFLAIIDEPTLEVTEAYKAFWTKGGASTRIVVVRKGTIGKFHLKDDGWTLKGSRASGLRFTAGLIRSWEVTKAATDPFNAIRHALSLALPDPQLLRPAEHDGPGYVYPARSYDNGANDLYSGLIPMGQMWALRPDYVIETAGLSNEGLALAYALRYYGAYVSDRSGYASLYAEQSVNGTAANRMKLDWQSKLSQNIVPVFNSTAANPGGPGVRTRPTAPPFAY